MQSQSTATEKIAAEMIRCGIAPLQMKYEGIYSASGSRLCALISRLYLATSGLGILSPDDYGYTASQSDRCIELFVRSLEIVCDEIPGLISQGFIPDFITVFIPVRALENTDIYETVKSVFEKKCFEHQKMICLLCDEGALYSDLSKLKFTLLDLMQLGVKTAISGIGHIKSPITALADLSFTYVFLDESISTMALSRNTEDRAVSLTQYIRSMNCDVIASGISNPEQKSTFYGAGCYAFTEIGQRLRGVADIAACAGEVSTNA